MWRTAQVGFCRLLKIRWAPLTFSLLVSSGWAEEPAAPAHRNLAPETAYVGSQVCAECHQGLSKRYYQQIAMGRSMAPANEPAELAKVPERITIYNAKSNRYFEVFRKDSQLYQSEYETDESGELVFKTTHKLDYVVGAGTNGFSYIIRRGNHLFQAPLSFYSNPAKWDLSPGYELGDVGFDRPIRAACLWCHNGQPEAVPHGEGLYREPAFRFGEPAIGCEVCHGPGQLHVEEFRRSQRRVAPGADTSIVNPVGLQPRLADDICVFCHQGGNTRLLQPGKDYSDFRPGAPLRETVAIFRLPLREDQRQEANLAEQLPPVRGSLLTPSWWKSSLMEWSKCYLESRGQMGCLTCHEIHNYPRPEERVQHYRKKCLGCHAKAGCSLPAQQRSQTEPANDCIGCHMPKRPVGGISHSSLTPHRIVRELGQPLPDVAFEQPTPELPGLIYMNGPGDRQEQFIPPLTKLAAYGEVMKKEPQLGQYYLETLDSLRRTAPDDPLVLASLGRKLLLEGNPDAAEHLSRALKNGSKVVSTYLDLADALARAGQVEEATQLLGGGVALWPYSSELRKSLILRYIALKRYGQALETMEQYMELFPQDSFMRALLKKAQSAETARRLLGNPTPLLPPIADPGRAP